jgi:PD-(D/E)XK nuclease superfamily
MEITDLEILEEFVRDNEDLDHLEALAGIFNTFQVLGISRREPRHSEFLAYLLDPHENHGLGDTFVRRLLKKACPKGPADANTISAIDLDTMDFDGLEVKREWKNIDILLEVASANQRLVAIIENKIDASEHSGQLQRYREQVTQDYAGWKTLFIYLSISGELPTDDSFVPIDYGSLVETLESALKNPLVSPSPEARSLILQYCQTVRRDFMKESDVSKMCVQIYKKHKRALDLIFEHRPDDQSRVAEILRELVGKEKYLVEDNPSKLALRFACRAWEVSDLKKGSGWTTSGRMLLFEFNNRKDQLKLILYIGPGPKKTRQKLLNMALSEGIFKPASKTLNSKWNSIFSRKFLSSNDYEDIQENQLEQKIKPKWEVFVKKELPSIMKAVRSLHFSR